MSFRDTSAGWTASLHRLKGAATRNPTADFENNVAQRDAHRNFNQTGVLNGSRQREDLGAPAALRADLREPLAAVAKNGRDVGERLDVIDEGRTFPQTRFGRVRRPG